MGQRPQMYLSVPVSAPLARNRAPRTIAVDYGTDR